MPDYENILTPPLMLVRYAGMASLLTTVWESRRKLQDRNALLAGRVEDTKALMGRHVDALHERIYCLEKRGAERIAELEAALEAKTTQHAETLDYLEHAYRVIDQQVRQAVREQIRFERLIGALWKSRRLWQERVAEVEAERDAAISIARSNSRALDAAKAELTRLRTDREQELTAIAAKQQRDARRIAELEAQVQR